MLAARDNRRMRGRHREGCCSSSKAFERFEVMNSRLNYLPETGCDPRSLGNSSKSFLVRSVILTSPAVRRLVQ